VWGDRSFFEYLADQAERHRGKAIGVILGLLAALLIIIFGFWKTVFIAILVLFGYWLGKRFDEDGSLDELWRRLFGRR
jgi:uncharacterized membrane protein